MRVHLIFFFCSTSFHHNHATNHILMCTYFWLLELQSVKYDVLASTWPHLQSSTNESKNSIYIFDLITFFRVYKRMQIKLECLEFFAHCCGKVQIVAITLCIHQPGQLYFARFLPYFIFCKLFIFFFFHTYLRTVKFLFSLGWSYSIFFPR